MLADCHVPAGYRIRSHRTVASAALDDAKNVFRRERDSIYDGASGEAAAQTAIAALSKVKSDYIDHYLAAHKKKRLGVNEAKRRQALQESGEGRQPAKARQAQHPLEG